MVGHSWGATLALLYAIEHPERVERLGYVSGTGIDPAWHDAYRENRAARLAPTSGGAFANLSRCERRQGLGA